MRSVIENPRQFIRSKSFGGHDRRRRQVPLTDDAKRRAEDGAANAAFLAGKGARRFEDIQLHYDAELDVYETDTQQPRLRQTLR